MPVRPTRQTQPPRDPQPRKGYVAVGWVRGSHGTHGALKVDPLTDFPHRFEPGASLWIAGERRTVLSAGSPAGRGTLVLELDEVETREDAQALRGLLLEVPEHDLPHLDDDQYFRFQLIGMSVFDADGAPLGRIGEVIDTGANDVYAVRDEEGELLIPAIDTVVKKVDVARRRMVVELMPGLERRPLKKQPKS
ncbi:MAG: ribosome maturation factor RimM [Dehalococcoidia bacterium]